MIEFIGMVAILAIAIYLIFWFSTQKEKENIELLGLTQYSDECKEFREKISKRFSGSSDYELKNGQLKLLKDPVIYQKAIKRKQNDEQYHKELTERLHRQSEDLKFYWRRDHAIIYEVFSKSPLMKELEIKEQLKRKCNLHDHTLAEINFQDWVKVGLIKKGGTFLEDQRSIKRGSEAINVGKFSIQPGDEIESINGSETYLIRSYTEAQGFFVNELNSRESKYIFKDKLSRLLETGFYLVKYDREYVYKIDKSFDYRDLVKERIIKSQEEYMRM